MITYQLPLLDMPMPVSFSPCSIVANFDLFLVIVPQARGTGTMLMGFAFMNLNTSFDWEHFYHIACIHESVMESEGPANASVLAHEEGRLTKGLPLFFYHAAHFLVAIAPSLEFL